ncbi:MAG: type II toxin-antitoxin system YafQ family toxin [Bifidobacterium subtile]|jgi:mRNA interferase YafQ|nr:type II toxin-antitoxin system YafQ family toxin [Bifidobacterium subtile]
MREIVVSQSFLRDVKHLKQKHYDMSLLAAAQRTLRANDRMLLSSKYKDHQLKGNLREFRELHIQGDWLLVYRVDGARIILARTGTHDGLL